jgi:hypothetical protein
MQLVLPASEGVSLCDRALSERQKVGVVTIL